MDKRISGTSQVVTEPKSLTSCLVVAREWNNFAFVFLHGLDFNTF